jgi:hypothetical protein
VGKTRGVGASEARPGTQGPAKVCAQMPRWLLSFASSAVAVLLAVTTLTGCGGASTANGVATKAPAEIVAAAREAADAANSVHVSGSIVSAGSPITLDLELAGDGGRGTVAENGLSFEVIHVGGTVYIKGSPAFYQHVGGAAAAQLLHGRWLKAPASTGSFASLASLTDLRRLVDMTLAINGTPTQAGTATVSGQKAIGVTDASKSGTLYVATTGSPYPIAVTEDGASSGRILLDRWNEPLSLAAPANAIDITKLQSGQ